MSLSRFRKFRAETVFMSPASASTRCGPRNSSGLNEPNSFVTSGGLGTMGFGLPAAIGAKVGRPDKDVWLIDGDGSFSMTLVDLATAATYNIPVKVAILNNTYLGMVRQWQELFFERRYSNVHYPENPDFARIAEGYHVRGFDVKDMDRGSQHARAGGRN